MWYNILVGETPKFFVKSQRGVLYLMRLRYWSLKDFILVTLVWLGWASLSWFGWLGWWRCLCPGILWFGFVRQIKFSSISSAWFVSMVWSRFLRLAGWLVFYCWSVGRFTYWMAEQLFDSQNIWLEFGPFSFFFSFSVDILCDISEMASLLHNHDFILWTFVNGRHRDLYCPDSDAT
jgi:hypothetical protein